MIADGAFGIGDAVVVLKNLGGHGGFLGRERFCELDGCITRVAARFGGTGYQRLPQRRQPALGIGVATARRHKLVGDIVPLASGNWADE
ncbi:hypothetical protein LBMAG56_19990 [Verrucomicrobiota bacterium]|nr:hypothetical protein LBMAG56_19990 [Verrucomicrobiota bacterium]